MITAKKDAKETTGESERFFGYLATAAESWKLILIIPVLVAALTYVYLVARPSLYRSDAVLRLTKDEVAVLKSAQVFGAALNKVSAADSPEAAASASVVASTPDSPDVSSVVVTYSSAAGAAAILQEMIDLLPGETMPSEYSRGRIEARLKVLQDAQDALTKSLGKVDGIYDQIAKSQSTGGAMVFGGDYGESNLIAALTANDKEISATEATLQSTFTSDDVIQPPTVPTRAIARSISPFVTLAFVLSLAILLILVVVWEALRTTPSSPNLARVRRALLPWLKS